ncbi:response regulator [Brumimicrobium aurantiacum]|uniref:Response regulator n=1 Tax=Brumimicrobium aurantiacum TaxID=1737063 RepID=A0A3E1F1W7_9FLAO|nr:response regulator [Brumimicrobium aurantiacum]RFC55821.1 response regulator [Brumimicrobium aurantiacum]
MKLDYKLLWLDDKIKSVVLSDYQDDIEDLKEYIKSLGFKETIDFVRTEEELFSKLDKAGEYDLIMTDYHLDETKGNTRNGAEIIKTIRDKNIFTEIMFYSAQGEIVDTHKLDRITFFSSSRVLGGDHYSAIFNKAKELIELTVRKFQNIVAMRGMIMHETSILDEFCFELISDYLTKTDSQKVKESIFDEIISFYKRKFEEVSKYKKNGRIDKVLNDPLLFSFSQRANTLKSIIEEINFDDFIDEFKLRVIKIRNQFAHSILEINEDGIEVFRNKSEDITFDEELCKQIRLDIINHKGNLDSLKMELDK